LVAVLNISKPNLSLPTTPIVNSLLAAVMGRSAMEQFNRQGWLIIGVIPINVQLSLLTDVTQ